MLKPIAIVFIAIIIDWLFFEYVINRPIFPEAVNYILFIILGALNLIGILLLAKKIILYINN